MMPLLSLTDRPTDSHSSADTRAEDERSIIRRKEGRTTSAINHGTTSHIITEEIRPQGKETKVFNYSPELIRATSRIRPILPGDAEPAELFRRAEQARVLAQAKAERRAIQAPDGGRAATRFVNRVRTVIPRG